MKNLFSFFVCLIITMVLLTMSYAQNRVSTDTTPGTQWEQYSDNPVIMPGVQGDWNGGSSFAPNVIMYKDTLRMWYVGSTVYGFNGTISIGYAWSLDGINWQQYSNNPILSPHSGDWEYPHLIYPHVIADGDTLRMWYGGGNMIQAGMRIGYATSTDGINWNRHTLPVIDPDADWIHDDWNKDGVLPGTVIKEGETFKMWFGGGLGTAGYPTDLSHWSIGYATSSDCIHWSFRNDPVLSHGISEDFDENEALNAYVIRTDSGYDMWYFGHNTASRKASIGYASSTDGINWTKYYNNPVLTSDQLSVPWAENYYDPCIYFDGEKFRMWFTGWDHDSQLIAIGYATSPLDTSNYSGIENGLLIKIPKECKLFQNYPNPFNPTTTISYSIPKQSHVNLKVYDILGNKIKTLIDEGRMSGTYKINFNASNLSSGIYFYRLQVDNYMESKKMILLK